MHSLTLHIEGNIGFEWATFMRLLSIYDLKENKSGNLFYEVAEHGICQISGCDIMDLYLG